MARCESCSKPASVQLKDGSTWCILCHAAALAMGYDDDFGERILEPVPFTVEREGE